MYYLVAKSATWYYLVAKSATRTPSFSDTRFWVGQLESKGQRFVHRVVGSQARRGSDNFCACFTDPTIVWSPDYGASRIPRVYRTPRVFIETVVTHNVSSGNVTTRHKYRSHKGRTAHGRGYGWAEEENTDVHRSTDRSWALSPGSRRIEDELREWLYGEFWDSTLQ